MASKCRQATIKTFSFRFLGQIKKAATKTTTQQTPSNKTPPSMKYKSKSAKPERAAAAEGNKKKNEKRNLSQRHVNECCLNKIRSRKQKIIIKKIYFIHLFQTKPADQPTNRPNDHLINQKQSSLILSLFYEK